MNRLLVDSVWHSFGNLRILEDVSLAVGSGEVACLLGPSGSGKTTLLRLIAGLERLQRGRIVVGDATVADARAGPFVPPEDRRVGLMFQDYALFPHMTVRQNILYGLRKEGAARRRWADEALARVGMAGYGGAWPHTLSGGQQQRVALLRAMAPGPRVLLLDEPFSDLDVTLRASVRDDTLLLLKDSNIASLVVTHDPEEAMYMADRVFVIETGRIVQCGTPAEIYLGPATPYVAGLFGPMNRFAGTVEDGRVQTPVGPIPAAGLAEGVAAEVLIRPEAVHLRAPGKSEAGHGACELRARVQLARPLGRTSMIHLATDRFRLRARVTGVFLPAQGTELAMSVDPRSTFVFPAADDGT